MRFDTAMWLSFSIAVPDLSHLSVTLCSMSTCMSTWTLHLKVRALPAYNGALPREAVTSTLGCGTIIRKDESHHLAMYITIIGMSYLVQSLFQWRINSELLAMLMTEVMLDTCTLHHEMAAGDPFQ